MLIHLSDYCQVIGRKTELKVDYTKDSIDVGGVTYDLTDKKPADFCIECTDKDKLSISFEMNIEASVPCDRCLKEVIVPVSVSHKDDIQLSETDGELDTDELLYREILIEWPSKVVCSDDCKGLCMKCGSDLNEGDCGCDRFIPDPRMAAILDVFNNSK